MTLISCIAMWLCTVCAYPHTIQVWGIVSFVLVQVFHNLQVDIRKATPHFLFYNYFHLGVEWQLVCAITFIKFT